MWAVGFQGGRVSRVYSGRVPEYNYWPAGLLYIIPRGGEGVHYIYGIGRGPEYKYWSEGLYYHSYMVRGPVHINIGREDYIIIPIIWDGVRNISIGRSGYTRVGFRNINTGVSCIIYSIPFPYP